MEWTRDVVISEIRRYSVNGVAPSSLAVPRLASAARRFFLNWLAACKAAGVRPLQDVMPRHRPERYASLKTAGVPAPKEAGEAAAALSRAIHEALRRGLYGPIGAEFVLLRAQLIYEERQRLREEARYFSRSG